MIKCLICEQEVKMITPQHMKMHGTTTAEYRERFPGARTRDPLVSAKTAARNQALKGVPRDPRLVEASASKLRGRKRPEHGAKVSAALKGVAKTEESKRKLSETMRRKMADPAHRERLSEARVRWNLANPRMVGMSSYEMAFVRELVREGVNYLYEPIRVKYELQGWTHTYLPDFYLPDFNLVVELKSKWVFKVQGYDTINAKLEATRASGYNVILILDYEVVYQNGWLKERTDLPC